MFQKEYFSHWIKSKLQEPNIGAEFIGIGLYHACLSLSILHLQQTFTQISNFYFRSQPKQELCEAFSHSPRKIWVLLLASEGIRPSCQSPQSFGRIRKQCTLLVSVMFLYILEKILALSLCLNLLQLLKLKLDERIVAHSKRSKSKASMLEQTNPNTQHIRVKRGALKYQLLKEMAVQYFMFVFTYCF